MAAMPLHHQVSQLPPPALPSLASPALVLVRCWCYILKSAPPKRIKSAVSRFRFRPLSLFSALFSIFFFAHIHPIRHSLRAPPSFSSLRRLVCELALWEVSTLRILPSLQKTSTSPAKLHSFTLFADRSLERKTKKGIRYFRISHFPSTHLRAPNGWFFWPSQLSFHQPTRFLYSSRKEGYICVLHLYARIHSIVLPANS